MEELRQPSLEQVQEAYKQAENSPEIQTLLRNLYGNAVLAKQPDNRPVTERIKTFEDACRELGENHPMIIAYMQLKEAETQTLLPIYDNADIVAYLKLRIICAALNEGWVPQFTEDEWRYYPYFWLYTQDEIDEMKNDEKQSRCLRPIDDYRTASAGFAFANSGSAPSYTAEHIGSRLCLKSDTLAVYCGKQFIDLWADFYLIRK